jgi:hypothetical protein
LIAELGENKQNLFGMNELLISGVKLVDIQLTEISKGNGSITIKKVCPQCNHEMVFGVLNGQRALLWMKLSIGFQTKRKLSNVLIVLLCIGWM